MKQVIKLSVKVPRTRRRADFLFHNGQFKPKCEQNLKAYDRKRLGKPDVDTY